MIPKQKATKILLFIQNKTVALFSTAIPGTIYSLFTLLNRALINKVIKMNGNRIISINKHKINKWYHGIVHIIGLWLHAVHWLEQTPCCLAHAGALLLLVAVVKTLQAPRHNFMLKNVYCEIAIWIVEECFVCFTLSSLCIQRAHQFTILISMNPNIANRIWQ